MTFRTTPSRHTPSPCSITRLSPSTTVCSNNNMPFSSLLSLFLSLFSLCFFSYPLSHFLLLFSFPPLFDVFTSTHTSRMHKLICFWPREFFSLTCWWWRWPFWGTNPPSTSGNRANPRIAPHCHAICLIWPVNSVLPFGGSSDVVHFGEDDPFSPSQQLPHLFPKSSPINMN